MNHIIEGKIREALHENLPDVPETFDIEIDQQLLKLTAEKKRQIPRRRLPIPVWALILVLGITTALAATDEAVNAWLYKQWPEMALTLMPVNLKSDDQGIQMEIISAVVEDQRGLVTFSMQDLQEHRIKEHMEAYLGIEYQGMSEMRGSSSEPYYEGDQDKLVFSEYFEVDPIIPFGEDHITITVNQLQGYQHTIMDLLPLISGNGSQAVLTDVPEDARAGDGSFPDSGKILAWDGTMEIPVGKGNHVFLTGISMVDDYIHVQYHILGNEQISVQYEYKDGNRTSCSYTLVRPWVNLLDTDGQLAYCDQQLITWGRDTDEPDDDYWVEWIFKPLRKLNEPITFNIQVDEYEPPLFGNWQVDIPLRLIRFVR